jgi:membrane-bound lytic murein transglycosylase B
MAVALAVIAGVAAAAPTAWAQTDPTTSTVPSDTTTTTEPAPTTTTTAPATTTTTPPPESTTAPPAPPTTEVPIETPVASIDDLNLAHISPELRGVPVSGFDQASVDAALAETVTNLAAVRAERDAADARIAVLTPQEATLASTLAAATVHVDEATQATDAARARLRDFAVARYIHGANSDLSAVVLNDPQQGTEAAGRAVVFAEVSRDRLDMVSAARADQAAARSALSSARRDHDEVLADLTATIARRDHAATTATQLDTALRDQRTDADRAQAVAIVAGTDLPVVALDAYWRAQQTFAARHPECGITWWALAGIGRSESNHGRSGGTLLEPDGETATPILGIVLDGTRNTRVITDTDTGRLDGDIEFDRAVGPMQFLPSTWERHALDGSGDGVADPHNLYDAALAAADYLCGGGPMNSEANLLAGFFRYNHSTAYANRVLARGYAYQAATAAVPALVALLPEQVAG